MVDKLNLAIVVELDVSTNMKHAASLIAETDLKVVCVSSIPPYKMLVFFDDELHLKIAMDETSPLRKLFSGVRRWSDDECYKERVVWVE